MKKKSILLSSVLAFVLLLPLLLTGCHGSRGLEPFEMPESLSTEKTYALTFWAKNDTNKNQTRVYENAIRDFEALYPNIHIQLRLYNDYNRIYNDVITNISTQTTPNICITYPDHIATYKTGTNVVVPLESLIADAHYGMGGDMLLFDGPTKEEIVPSFLTECQIDGVQYALPYMRSTEALYINKTFVEALGYTLPDVLTWNFIWEVSDAAAQMDADGTYLLNGQKVMIPFIYKSTDNMMIQMLRQKGAGYADTDGNIAIFNDVTRSLLFEIAEHVKRGAFSTFKISSYPANFLNAGQCVFAIDSTAGSTWMGTDAPLSDISEDALVPFEIAVRPVPQFDTSHPQMISQGPSVCIFNKRDPEEVLASWLFTQYLLTNSIQIAYAETEGYIPVTTKAQNDPAYQTYLSSDGIDNTTHYPVKLEASRLLLSHISDTFVTPVFNGSASLRSAAGQMIENVAKSVRRKETVDDAYMDELKNNMISLYRLDRLGQTDTRGEKEDLGPLPPAAIALLVTICVVWAGIIGYFLYLFFQKKKQISQ